ncbi:MAG: hypothetical protein WCI04_04450 [archaeon]
MNNILYLTPAYVIEVRVKIVAELTERKKGRFLILDVCNNQYHLQFVIEIKNGIMHINHFTGTGVGLLLRTGLSRIKKIAKEKNLGIDAHIIDEPRLKRMAILAGFSKDKRFAAEKYDGLVERFVLKKRQMPKKK